MKNIVYTLIVFLQLFALQLIAQDQPVLDNGRDKNTVAATPAATQEPVQQNLDDTGEIDDADIPGTYYLRSGTTSDVIIGEEDTKDLFTRLDNMESELQELRKNNELLARENQTMKTEMSNCCAEASASLGLAGSYLMQNSPNPFQADTNIRYFIADDALNAQLELRNIDGVLLQSFNIDQRGLGELRLDRKAYNKGSYVYTLTVDGKIIDSKVMILQ